MKTSYIFLKINNIAGIFYKSPHKTNTIIVYGVGAPIVPDNGNLPDASIILDHGIDIFVPDYIGYGRSDGIFTPMNCINTFLQLYTNLLTDVSGKNSYSNYSVKLQYKRIIFIGRSLGGTYIPLLPRFNKNIKELAIFCPVVDSKSCGSIQGEESNEDFLRSMKYDGYHYLYRGILEKKWKEHLYNKDDLSPMDNIQCLEYAKLFIAHGKKDTCVHFSKSIQYYEKIKRIFPTNNHTIKLYQNGDHGSSTTNQATSDFLHWLGF